jgi:hypothetical protein
MHKLAGEMPRKNVKPIANRFTKGKFGIIVTAVKDYLDLDVLEIFQQHKLTIEIN